MPILKENNKMVEGNVPFSNSRETDDTTTLIDEVVSSWLKYCPKIITVGKSKQNIKESDKSLSSAEVDLFLNSYYEYLKNIWSSTLREEGRKLLNNPDESLIFGGDKLHLSNTYREEHVTAWLCWILRGDILEDTMREKIVNYIFSNIIKSENYKQYVSGTEKEFNLPISGAKITLEYPLKGKYIDLLIESSHSVVAIENKIGDLNFKKNKKYKEDLDKQFSGKNIFGFLLLPKNDLDNYLDEEPGEKNEEKKNSKQETEKQNILHAFPPVTWEEFLMILRSAINHFNNDHQRWKHWKSLSLAFISFVEGNVLGYNFEEINKALLYDKSTPDYNIIRQINNYLNYRKDGFQ